MKVEILENQTLLFFPESMSEETAVKSIQGCESTDEETNLVYHEPTFITVKCMGVEDFGRDEALERLYGEHGKPIHKEEWEYDPQCFTYTREVGTPEKEGMLKDYLNKMGCEGWEVVNINGPRYDHALVNKVATSYDIFFKRRKP